MLWPMVLPPYHSLCRKNQGLLFRDKELSWTFPGRDSDEARPSWRIIPWHLTVGGPLPDLSPSSGRPHCHWGGKDFTLALWDAACPDISVPLWFSGISIVPWAKSQGISTLPVVCVGHGGEDWASHLLSESQTLPVSGEVDTVCPKTTHLEGCNETLWKKKRKEKKRYAWKCFENIRGCRNVPDSLTSFQIRCDWVPEKLIGISFSFCFVLPFFPLLVSIFYKE